MKRTCSCGLPVHYNNEHDEEAMDRLIAELGPMVVVTVFGGSFRIPRDYIALHGIKADEVPALAQRYGWERVEP